MLARLLVTCGHHEHQCDARADDQQSAYPVRGAQRLAEHGEPIERRNDDGEVGKRAYPRRVGLLVCHRDADLTSSRPDAYAN